MKGMGHPKYPQTQTPRKGASLSPWESTGLLFHTSLTTTGIPCILHTTPTHHINQPQYALTGLISRQSYLSELIHAIEVKSPPSTHHPHAFYASQRSEVFAAIEPLWTGAKSNQVFSPSFQQ